MGTPRGRPWTARPQDHRSNLCGTTISDRLSNDLSQLNLGARLTNWYDASLDMCWRAGSDCSESTGGRRTSMVRLDRSSIRAEIKVFGTSSVLYSELRLFP